MRLLAWKVSTRWTQFHISAIGKPLCGTAVPEKVQASVDKPAAIKDWRYTCSTCRELAVRGATTPIDEPPKVIDLMAALKAALKTKPADRGEAVDGPNEQPGLAGPGAVEATAPARNEQTV